MNVQPQYVPNQQYQQQYIQSQYGQGTNSQQSPTPPPNFYPNPPMAAQGHYPPPGGNNQGAPIFKEGYEQGPGPFQPSARSDPRFGNNASPPLYSQPTDRKIDSSPQPPPQVYAQQQQSPQPQSPYQQQPGYPQIQPQPYPAMQTTVTQPTAIQGMDVRNMRNKPRDANGDREFSNGLCGCFDACGTCAYFHPRLCFVCLTLHITGCLAWCCPCITYGQNKTRLDHLQRNGYPHPDGGESCGVDCLVHGALMCLGGWGWILQVRRVSLPLLSCARHSSPSFPDRPTWLRPRAVPHRRERLHRLLGVVVL